MSDTTRIILRVSVPTDSGWTLEDVVEDIIRTIDDHVSYHYPEVDVEIT